MRRRIWLCSVALIPLSVGLYIIHSLLSRFFTLQSAQSECELANFAPNTAGDVRRMFQLQSPDKVCPSLVDHTVVVGTSQPGAMFQVTQSGRAVAVERIDEDIHNFSAEPGPRRIHSWSTSLRFRCCQPGALHDRKMKALEEEVTRRWKARLDRENNLGLRSLHGYVPDNNPIYAVVYSYISRFRKHGIEVWFDKSIFVVLMVSFIEGRLEGRVTAWCLTSPWSDPIW